ncbi:MAG: hypothetical protein H6737_26525 [Alphaproteobacteria bacterium]|nr:hypothetical protein [Alphaproteobacteria bacterium]
MDALLWLGPVAGLAVCAGYNAVLQPWTLDDAYISFRYAEHFAGGEGLVYNPGERVEGYTTFLWVFLLGVGHALGADTRTLAKVLGAVFAAGSILLLSQAHRFHRGIPPIAGSLAAALVGSSAIFGAWAMPGMEVPLVAFLLLASALGFAREADAAESGGTPRGWWAAGICGALALMSRPDSVVLVSVLSAWLLGLAALRRDPRLARAPLVVAGLYGPYFAWRFAYYGWLLPNTFYAKVGSTGAQVERGVRYVTDFVEPAAFLLVPAVLLVPFAKVAWSRFGGLAPLWAGVALHAAYVVSVGGDVMPAFRFFAHVLPVIGLLAGLALSLAPRLGVGVVAVAVAYNVWQFGHHADLRPRIERGIVGLNGEEVGLWMRENLAPDGLLATNTAGSVPYFSRLRTVDMLGLNDAHIAHREMPRMGRGRAGHEKADGAYVLSRDPDYVHFGSALGRDKPVFASDRELYAQPGFTERYVLRRYRLPSGNRLALWVKKGAPAP